MNFFRFSEKYKPVIITIATVLRNAFFLFIFLLTYLSGFSQERQYLSGKGPDDAVLWDFKISEGRNSGFWSTIPVPSNWELQGFGYYTYGEDREDYKTNPEIGFYKRTFELSSVDDKYFRLVFQGSMTDTKVKINGKLAGDIHQGGYTQFSYDISEFVQNGENTIEVEVSKPSENTNLQQAERVADFWLFGGIYRPVYIDILPVTHIERIALDATMHGQLEIDTFINNSSGAETLSAQVLTIEGEPVGEKFSAKLAKNDSIIRLSAKLNNIKLWSHELPNLYKLKLSLKKNDQIVHSISERFGFRTFEVRDHDGFYLNEERILLKGASMHSFRPETGRSLSAKDNLEDLRLMKALNFNTVRAPCYPPDEHFLALCDSLGLLVLNELPGWSTALETGTGKKLVKELVTRDVNHPSVIMWGNGNHYAHNAELETIFLKWDIQKRRPYKNAAFNEAWPGKDHGKFELIDTRYYPTYEQLTNRLAGDQIVMPNETLHALYDGGGGAGLADYWKALEQSKVGGGLIIWALYDEGLVRTDEGFRVDNQGNKAPDGIVGPHQEKKGSYYAVKEIWSPVQIMTKEISNNFDGKVGVENKFDFTNLNQCSFHWKYISFASPEEASNRYRIVEQGKLEGPDINPGAAGNLEVPVSKQIDNADALELTAYDPFGNELWTWRLMKTSKIDFLTRFLKSERSQGVQQDSLDKWLFRSGSTTFRFAENSAGPMQILTDSISIPLGPLHIVAKSDSTYYKAKESKSNLASIEKIEESYLISYNDINGFDEVEWTVLPNGVLKLAYTYQLPEGEYYYAGVGFDLPSEEVRSKRWLGEGPYRIYKNRGEGTKMNVWQVQKQVNIPGVIYNFPEFEGFFGNWYWAQFNLNSNRSIGLATEDENLYLGVLKPNPGTNPMFANIHYPQNSGIYFFNYISPIGEKWNPQEDIGPQGQLNKINGKCTGSVYFRYDWSVPNAAVKKFEIEIK